MSHELAPHGLLRENYGDESPRMEPLIGDFLDVLTLESADTQEWAVAMATLNKHPGTGKSQLGGECRVRNPWPGTEVALLMEGKKKKAMRTPMLTFATKKGRRYLLVPADAGKPGALAVAVEADASK